MNDNAPNVRSQAQIIADLLDRAEKLEHSARTVKHTKGNKIALQLAARVLRVAAEQNSPGYVEDSRDNTTGGED